MKRHLLNIFFVLGIAALVVYVWRDHPPLPIDHFSLETLKTALDRHDVLSVQYTPSSQELRGRVRPEKASVYGGDEFRLSEPLPLSFYKEFLSQQLTVQRFLGPIAGLQINPDFDRALGVSPAQAKSLPLFQAGETSTYELRALGMTLGELRLVVMEPVRVQNQLSYYFQVRAQTSSAYARFYRIQDQAETYVRAADFTPLAFSLLVDESERYGGLFEAHKGRETESWTSLVTRTQGLQVKKATEVRDLKFQNFVSALFQLRVTDWSKEQALHLYDQGKTITIRGKALRTEEIKTPLGPKKAQLIEPEIEVDGARQSKLKVSLWLGEDRVLYRIEADVKIGRVVAELRNYVSKMQE